MARPAGDWRVRLMALAGGGGALVCLGLAVVTAGYAMIAPGLKQPVQSPAAAQDPTGVFVLSGAMALVAAVLLVTLAAAVQTLRGGAETAFEMPPMRWWSLIVWIAAWLSASVLAQLLYGRERAGWAIPILHVVGIAAPVYVLVRVAVAGIRGGSKLRLWGSLSTGMLVGTGLAASIEVALLILGGIIAGIYFIANPGSIQALQRLALQLARAAGPGQALAVLGPIFANPVVLLVALTAVAVISPMVEEITKSLPAWALGRRLSTGAEGFWVGALSGAGFALLEGLMVSANPGEGAASLLMLRAGSSLMHVVASGLAGWGIGAFRADAKLARLALGYLGAMGVHAMWNTAVVLISYGGIRLAYGTGPTDVLGLGLSLIGAVLLVILLASLPLSLSRLNRCFRNREQSPTVGNSLTPSQVSSESAEHTGETP